MTQEAGFGAEESVPTLPPEGYVPPQSPASAPAPAPEPVKAPKKMPIPAIIAVFVVIGLAMAGYFAFRVAQPNILQKAVEKCNTGTLADSNKTLLFDMAGKEIGSGSGSIADMNCLLLVTETPTAVNSSMMSTRALDGKQSDHWKTSDGTKVSAQWKYHPDQGLDIIFQIED